MRCSVHRRWNRDDRARHVPPGRSLYLVDIENLTGSPWPTCAEAGAAIDELTRLVPSNPGDHVVVGASRVLGLDVKRWWPDVRVVTGAGPHGADLALLDVVADTRWIAARYDRIVVASGDHIFVPAVEALRRRGAVVGVVSRAGSLSRDLRRSASFARTWEPAGRSVPAAAA